MDKITGFICAYNEEDNIVDCLKSLKGVDEMIVADGGSTDRTRELAGLMGAKVFIRDDRWDTGTEENIKAFEKRFGWTPTFKVGDKLYAKPDNLIRALSCIKDGWVLGLDADERLTWDEQAVRALLPTTDQISCTYNHDHNPDGTPTWSMKLIKLYRKGTEKFIGCIHGTIDPQGRQFFTDKMLVDHYPKWDNKRSWGNRSYVLPNLEYSVMVDDNARNRFYLGREYFYYKKYKECVRLMDLYLKVASWWPEIALAHLYKAKAHWELQEGNKAREEALEAVRMNPSSREALEFMGVVYFEPWGHKWRELAKVASQEDVLFTI